ncbi:MAG TPA: hypothetical protein VIV11_14795 [Kofleriaceae bacterium]
MRFCPFCSAENADESAVCASCGRRLPPLPPRRAGGKGPPTGVQLPPRANPAATPPPTPMRKSTTMPPPIPSAQRPDATAVTRESAPSLPPPPAVDEQWGNGPSAQLRNAIAPGPAAERRDALPPEPAGGPGRRKSDSKAPPLPQQSGFARASSSGGMTAPGRSGAMPPSIPTSPDTMPFELSDAEPVTTVAPEPGQRGFGSPQRSSSPSTPPSTPPPIARSKSPSMPPTPRVVDPIGGGSAPPAIDPRAKRPSAPPPPRSAAPFNVETDTDASSYPLQVAAAARRAPTGHEPPPTRIHRPDVADRPFTPQKVNPIPEIPEPGLVNAARYAYQFALARWQRRGAIKTLGIEIKQDTEALDQVLGALGRAARGARVEGRVFSAENAAISAAEDRVSSLTRETGEVDGRKVEENSKFVDVERERNEKLVEAERMVEEAQRELQHLEAQRRALRDKRKELDRRQKAFLKNADDQDRQAGSAPLGDQRQELRRGAEGHRKEAAALEPDKQELDRRITALERPISEATARLDAAKAELDASKRSLNDAREGHTHRLAELDAEQKRKAREVALAEAEIQRRLVTLGTLVNLNRIEDPQFAELYHRIDRLRGAITARTTEIEKLNAEREAYDRGTLVRGVATIGGAFVALIALIVILRAVL